MFSLLVYVKCGVDNRHDRKNQPFEALNPVRGADGRPFRWTAQRREIHDLLMQERDHPTANELFIKAQQHVPGISLATVYNSLEALTQAGVIKHVNIDRGPARYCPNLREHAHLFCEKTGEVIDINLKPGVELSDIFDLPNGVTLTAAEISLKGRIES